MKIGKRVRKGVPVLLVLVMLLCMIPAQVFADMPQSVGIGVTGVTTTAPGEPLDLHLTLNALTADPYMLRFETPLTGLSAEDSPVFTRSGDSFYVATIAVDERVPEGYYDITITAVSSEDASKVYGVRTIVMRVIETEPAWSSADRPLYDLSYHIDGDATALKAGESKSVTFYLYNRGNVSLDNGRVSVTLPGGVSIRSGAAAQNVGRSGLQQTVSASYDLSVDKTVTDGSYPFSVSITGVHVGSDGPQEYTVTETVYIPVTGIPKEPEPEKPKEEDETLGNPILLLSAYSFGGEAITAGDEFDLVMTFTNTSNKTALSNIKVTVNAGATFIPVGTSNSFYIDSVGRGGSVSRTVRLSCSKDAVQGPVSVTVSSTYEDEKRFSHSASDSISVPVVQQTRFKVDEILDPGYLTAGSQGWLSVNYYNMGKTVLYNLRIQIEGDFSVEGNPVTYVGNMASGRSDYYNATIMPNEEGECHGKLTFTFEDAAGEEHVVEKEFLFNIGAAPVWDDPGWVEPIDPEPQGFHMTWWMWAAAGALLLVILIVIIAVAKKRKAKKNRELELDE